MTLELLIGTSNPGKVHEYEIMLADLNVQLLTLADVGLDKIDVEETGDTFVQNAELKALAYAEASGSYALADDSGLCVAALDGRPGVFSARYGGAGLDDKGRRELLLHEMEDVADRSAHFECVISLVDPRTLASQNAQGKCYGMITWQNRGGSLGFGYDAIFMPNGYSQTFAQLPQQTKNKISHRGKAIRNLIPILHDLLAS